MNLDRILEEVQKEIKEKQNISGYLNTSNFFLNSGQPKSLMTSPICYPNEAAAAQQICWAEFPN
jgi:hypothetical protein